MSNRMHPDMIEATRLTRAGRLTDATALLQRLLRGATPPDAAEDIADAAAAGRSPIIDVVPETVAITDLPRSRAGQGVATDSLSVDATERTPRPHLPEALRDLLARVTRTAVLPGLGELAQPPAPARDIMPAGARFVTRSYANEVGQRAYKLYVPSCYREQALPLVVMLHGCTQSPDDFAAGTRMNALAEEHSCLIVYPAQAPAANNSKCWNWFSPGDQRRGAGEPSLIAGITREIMRDYSVDPRRVYVAGLSAGGAAAAIMGATYPDLYAAVGVHSGLACGAASDLPSAFAAMRHGAKPARRSGNAASAEGYRRNVPTIVFHGDQDATVHPRNGDQVAAQSMTAAAADLTTTVQHGQVPGGHAFSCTLHADASGQAILEQWTIHGAGHAWAGGSPAGSYTDPRGPDASREMLRFFIEHPLPTC